MKARDVMTWGIMSAEPEASVERAALQLGRDRDRRRFPPSWRDRDAASAATDVRTNIGIPA